MQKLSISKFFNLFKKIKFNLRVVLLFSFWKYLLNLKSNKKKKNEKIFIFDNFEELNNTIFRGIYLYFFSKILKSNLYYVNYKFNPIFKLIYYKIGAEKLNVRLDNDQKKECNKLVDDFFLLINSKKDILNYEIDNLNIGMDIYESYLIKYKKPTIELISKKNTYLRNIVIAALTYYIFWRDFISSNKDNITGVLLSHRNYIETNILNRISVKNKINVYTLVGTGTGIQRWRNTDLNFFKHYEDVFNQLDKNKKKEAINWSKERLNLRFEGKVGVDMPYSSKSAFSLNNQSDEISNSSKIKILICSSCFFDNPHCYGKMIFEDFYECLSFLAKISHETDYEWYIKPHPDYLPGTIEILNECKLFFKKAEIISEHTSFHNLKNKINYAITTYGSIGHELPLLGIPVINCSNINPHQIYDFNFTPKNKKDLEFALKNLNKIKIYKLEDIYKFYYVHYKFFEPNDLIDEDSLNKNKAGLNDMFKNINYFCEEKINLEKISNRIFKFIKNNEFNTSNNETLNLLKKINNINFYNEKIF